MEKNNKKTKNYWSIMWSMLACTNPSGVHGLEENERVPRKMKQASTVRTDRQQERKNVFYEKKEKKIRQNKIKLIKA